MSSAVMWRGLDCSSSSRIRRRGWVTFNPALRRSCDSIRFPRGQALLRTGLPGPGVPGAGTPDERDRGAAACVRAWWMRASVYHRRVIRLSQTPMPKHTMHKLLLVLSIAMITGGCGILYKQPIYQGNLLEKANVDQLQT